MLIDTQPKKKNGTFAHFCTEYKRTQNVYTSICLYVCTSVRLYVYTSVCLYVCTSIRLFVYTSICLYVYTSIRLHVYTSIRLYVYTSIFLYVYTSIRLYAQRNHSLREISENLLTLEKGLLVSHIAISSGGHLTHEKWSPKYHTLQVAGECHHRGGRL